MAANSAPNCLPAFPAPSIVVLIGPPCSGKSTWCRQYPSRDVVSYDAIAGMLAGGDTLNQEHWELWYYIVEQRARLGCRSIVDATNLNWIERRRLLDIAHRAGVLCEAVVFECSRETLDVRNRARGGDAHHISVIAITHDRLTRLLPTIGHEGFERVHRVQSEELDQCLDYALSARTPTSPPSTGQSSKGSPTDA